MLRTRSFLYIVRLVEQFLRYELILGALKTEELLDEELWVNEVSVRVCVFLGDTSNE
jgi:hypothetical protein